MKIRFHGQEVRFRLGLAEVAALCDARQVQTQMFLGPNAKLSFIVRPSDIPEIKASFVRGGLLVLIPHTLLEGWLNDSREGFERTQPLFDETSLKIKIEKDYACLHPKEDDPSENTFEWARQDVTAMPQALSPHGKLDD